LCPRVSALPRRGVQVYAIAPDVDAVCEPLGSLNARLYFDPDVLLQDRELGTNKIQSRRYFQPATKQPHLFVPGSLA
jgi:hypothetical protein